MERSFPTCNSYSPEYHNPFKKSVTKIFLLIALTRDVLSHLLLTAVYDLVLELVHKLISIISYVIGICAYVEVKIVLRFLFIFLAYVIGKAECIHQWRILAYSL